MDTVSSMLSNNDLRRVATEAGVEFLSLQEGVPPCPVLMGISHKSSHFAIEIFPDGSLTSVLQKIKNAIQEKIMSKATAAPAQTKPLSLKAKCHAIYGDIDFIGKDGENTSQHYKYTRASDVVRNIRAALIEHRIYAEINFDFDGGPYTVAREKAPNAPFTAVNVRCSVVLHDLDSDEVKTGSGLGSGCDTNDKAAYKAQTGALKYALKNAFLIPDEAGHEMDAEADESVDAKSDAVDSSSYQNTPRAAQRVIEPDAKPEPKQQSRPEPAARPTPAPAPKQQAEAASTTSSAPTEKKSPAPSAEPSSSTSTPNAGTAEATPGSLSEADLEIYRTKFTKLGNDLSTDGKLKSSKSLPVNRKLLVFLLSVTKAPAAAAITKTQWDDFFARVDAARGNPEVGLVGITTLVNRANGIEDKKSK